MPEVEVRGSGGIRRPLERQSIGRRPLHGRALEVYANLGCTRPEVWRPCSAVLLLNDAQWASQIGVWTGAAHPSW